jgi:hypothetical protein
MFLQVAAGARRGGRPCGGAGRDARRRDAGRDGCSMSRWTASAGRDVRRDLAAAVVGRGWGLLELRPMRMSLEDIFLHLTTDDPPRAGEAAPPPDRRPPMRNVLAIAGKELRSYFASPIASIVLGFYALLFGYFFYAAARLLRAPEHADGMGMGPATMNINQMLIAPLFMNATVIALFVLPMITMRTYSEEKRSGTIELLLTAPLTDLQIILGKFLGAMGLYASMLAVTLLHMGVLFYYGNPEWRPVATAYLGCCSWAGASSRWAC